MKKLLKIVSCIAFISIFLFSCQPKPIYIDIPQQAPKLSIFSQIIPNQVMMIGVTRSFSSLTQITGNDTSTIPALGILVGHARVILSHDNINDTLVKLVDGVYVTYNTNLVNNKNYTVVVYDSTSGMSAYATTQVMPMVDDSLNVNITKGATDTNIKFTCTINDEPNTEDYYYMSISPKGKGSFLNPGSSFFSSLTNQNAVVLMTDKEAVNNVITKEYTNDNLDFFITPHDSVTVLITHISKDYFQFLTAYKRSGSIINVITGEPINYPTNVINGYGIFTAHFPSIYYLDMKDY